jgi:membrane protease YdiL (CAAX protease family)
LSEAEPIRLWHYGVVVISAGLLSFLLTIIESQPNIGQSILIAIDSFVFRFLIFILFIPSINSSFINRLKTNPQLTVFPLGIVTLFPLLNWFYSSDIFSAIVAFSLWYALPTAVMGVPLISKHQKLKQFDFVFHIVGVLVFWVGFDMRFTYAAVNGFAELRYEFSVLWISTLIILLLAIQLNDFDNKFNWRITGHKLVITVIGLSILLVTLVPLVLMTGFLSWNPIFDQPEVIFISFIGIWLTIALPEEIVHRGVIQHQLAEHIVSEENKYHKYWKWVVLVIVSILFGLSHWNNTSEEFVWTYIILATGAGIVYGICWWFGGLFSAMLIHTLVDWIWSILF